MSERSRRRWLISFIVSAVLNVFLIGFLAGRHAFGPGGCGPRGFGHASRGGGFQKYVSAEDRKRFREELGQLREARGQVRSALQREPFDRAQLEAALSSLRERSAALQLDMHRELVETASALNPEQRKRLAESRILRPALGP